jgi:hypothetical protein
MQQSSKPSSGRHNSYLTWQSNRSKHSYKLKIQIFCLFVSISATQILPLIPVYKVQFSKTILRLYSIIYNRVNWIKGQFRNTALSLILLAVVQYQATGTGLE